MRSVGVRLLPLFLFAGCKPTRIDVSPELTVTPDRLDFGSVAVGSAYTLEITLANSGGGSVAVLSLTLTDGDPDVFTVDRGDLQSIGPESEGTVLVTFTPEQEQPYSGNLQLRTDWAVQGSSTVSLAGTGGLSTLDYDADGFSVADGDCDDGNAAVNPGAEEICSGVDDDCNGIWFENEVDGDGDGAYVCEGDCDDTNGAIYPDATEICDGLDNDCNAGSDELGDGDVDGFTICTGDCDDTLPEVNPSRAEVCDGVDNDCDGGTDDIDADGDGHTVCSAAGDCDDTNASAYPVVVSNAGSSSGPGTDDAPWDTIANGLANLDSVCRTVVLESGTYSDTDVDWSSGEVEIVGRTGTPSDVQVLARADDRHFTVSGGRMVLRDLTLSGGNAPDDGGSIQVVNAALELNGVVFSGNTSANDGGAVAAVSSDLEMRGRCRFEGNIAADDGGALLLDASTVDDAGSTYVDNTGVRGGAIYVQGGDVSIDDAELRSNDATIEGGALAINGDGSYRIERSWFASNTAGVDGGGIVLRDVDDAGSEVRNNRIQDNVAQAGGGGVAVLGNTGALRIENNTFTGNEAVGGEGGALLVQVVNGGALQVLSNVMHSNDGDSALFVNPGAGAFVAFDTVYLTNSGIHFGGEAGDGTGAPLDPTNQVRNPELVAISDDGNPDNDDLTLQGSSPEIDSGPELPELVDTDGSRNDRGYTGGPAATH